MSFFTRIKNIFTDVNEQTDGNLLHGSLFILWIIVCVILYSYDYAAITHGMGHNNGIDYIIALTLKFVLNGLVYILGTMIIAMIVLGVLAGCSWMTNIVTLFKKATQKEFKIKPKPAKPNGKIVFPS